MPSTEDRLARIEEDNYFLGRRVDELNEALVFQQRQYDLLEKRLAKALDALERLKGLVEREEVHDRRPQIQKGWMECPVCIPPAFFHWVPCPVPIPCSDSLLQTVFPALPAISAGVCGKSVQNPSSVKP